MLKDEIASGGQVQGQRPAIPALEAEAGWFQARMDLTGTQINFRYLPLYKQNPTQSRSHSCT